MPVEDKKLDKNKSGINVLQPNGTVSPQLGQNNVAQQGETAIGGNTAFTSSGQSTQPGSTTATEAQPVKLENYLKANEGQGGNLMQEVQRNQAGQADLIKQQIENQKNQVLQNLNQTYTNQGNLRTDMLGQNNQGGFIGDVANFQAHQNLGNYQNQNFIKQAKDIYSGKYKPAMYNLNQQNLGALQRRADSASKMFQGLGTDDYRKMIMQKTFGKGKSGYTRGATQLDNLLMGRGVSERQQKKFLSDMQNMGRNTQSAINQARQAVKTRQSDIYNQQSELTKSLKDRLDTLYGIKNEEGQYTTGIAKSLQDKLNERKAIEQGIRESVAEDGDNTLTQDQMDYLGLTEGSRLWGLNADDFLQAGERTIGDIANKTDLTRLNSIAELIGTNQDIIADQDRVLSQDKINENTKVFKDKLLDKIKEAEINRIREAYREIGSGHLIGNNNYAVTFSPQQVADWIRHFQRGGKYKHSWSQLRPIQNGAGTIHKNWEDAKRDLDYLINHPWIVEDKDGWTKKYREFDAWRERGNKGIQNWENLINKKLGLESNDE